MVARYRRLFDYEKDAHNKVIGSLETVPVAARGEEAFQKAVSLFAHIVVARLFWLYRLGLLEQPPTDFFPAGLQLDELRPRLEAMNQAWAKYFDKLDDVELERVCEYITTEGEPYRTGVEDILTQLFGHSLYHRGHIASLVQSLGGAPAATDFIFWAREPS